MKKLLTIALLAASAASFAQGLIGPKIGLNFSNIKNTKTPTGSTADDYSYVVTPSAGIVFNAQIGEHFAIRPEVLWVQRGANLKDSATRQNTKIVTNYVEVPFNLVGRIKVGIGKIEVFAGPAVGYNLGGTYSGPNGSGKVKGEDKPAVSVPGDNTFYMNYLNVSMNIGVGYNFKGLVFQAGYNLGFSNLNAHPEDNGNTTAVDVRKEDVLKASSVNFGVVYLFGKKDIF